MNLYSIFIAGNSCNLVHRIPLNEYWYHLHQFHSPNQLFCILLNGCDLIRFIKHKLIDLAREIDTNGKLYSMQWQNCAAGTRFTRDNRKLVCQMPHCVNHIIPFHFHCWVHFIDHRSNHRDNNANWSQYLAWFSISNATKSIKRNFYEERESEWLSALMPLLK